MNVSGSYRVILDGEEVAYQKNVITNAGKTAIRKFLAGDYKSWAEAIGVGASSVSASASQVKLDFEVDRQPVTVKSTIKPRHYISSVSVASSSQFSLTLLETPKIEVGDTIVVYGTLVSGASVNGTWTVSGKSGKTITVSSASGLTTQTTSQINRESYVEGEDAILLKTILPDSLEMSIREIGVFSSFETRYDSGYNVGIITDFSEDEWSGFSTTSGYSARVGSKLVNPSTTKTLSDLTFSLDSYSAGDKLQLLLYNPSVSTSAKTITFTFYSATSSQQFVFTLPANSATGAFVLSIEMSSISISTIRSMTVSSSESVFLDALSAINYDEFGYPDRMISRSALSSPVSKSAGQQLEIEYFMRIS